MKRRKTLVPDPKRETMLHALHLHQREYQAAERSLEDLRTAARDLRPFREAIRDAARRIEIIKNLLN
jgi:hypothetical protein